MPQAARPLGAEDQPRIGAEDQPRSRPELRVVTARGERGALTQPTPGRRTITITGNPTPPRRRVSRRQQQIAARPDRVALWAVLLGLFLIFMAVATAHASV